MSLAVIFDMDGLMLDTEVVSRRVWREAAVALGIDLSEAVLDAMVGRPEAATRVMLAELCGEAVPALVARAQARYRDVLVAEGVRKKPGLDALLAWLVAHGVPRAVATSTARDLADYKLRQAGLLAIFDAVVCGDEVPHGKPAPDIFLAAAERLGRAPAECVVLEDSGPGVLAARAAGMTTILVPDGREPPSDIRQVASHVVASLTDVLPILMRGVRS